MSFLVIPDETPHHRELFDRKWVRTPDGCHRWIACKRGKRGYGGFQIGYRLYAAHRVAYAWKNGDVSTDLHHICENEWCVNPDHLIPATINNPQPRHRSEYEHLCAHGHEFTEENTYVNPRGERQCRACLREASRRHAQANRDKINAKKRAKRARVVYEKRPCSCCGLPFTPVRSTGTFCDRRECVNERQRLNRLGRLGRLVE